MVSVYRGFCIRPAWCAALFSAVICLSWFSRAPGQVGPSDAPREAPRVATLPSGPAAKNEGPKVVREGTKIEGVAGMFTVDDERLTFHSSDKRMSLVVLENLALERVAQAVAESSHDLQWIVDGTVTEYRGANHLLITHALVRRASISQRAF